MTVLADTLDIQRNTAAGIDFLRRHGNGAQPLVLLHGVGSNAESFVPLMSTLPPAMDIIAWDAPGYGRSMAPATSAPTPRDYADALAALLDALDFPRIVLAGHSLGCLFAAGFAAHYPARVSALTLMSPALGYKVVPGAALPSNVQGRIDDLQQLGPAKFAATRAPRLVSEPQSKPDIVAAVEKAMAAVHPGGYAQAVHALGTGDLLANAAQISAPTLVAVGINDVVTPPANARTLHDALKNPAGFHAIAGAGHALPQEQPKTVAGIMTKFIAEHANG